MPVLSKSHQFRALIYAPAVAAGYAAIALAVVRVGCTPPFLDTEVFGVPAASFLLLALTVSALILIVLAGMHAWRSLRLLRRRRGAVPAAARLATGGVALAAAAFAATAWLGTALMHMPCT